MTSPDGRVNQTKFALSSAGTQSELMKHPSVRYRLWFGLWLVNARRYKLLEMD